MTTLLLLIYLIVSVETSATKYPNTTTQKQGTMLDHGVIR
jgi:hypothetical protein